MKTIYVGETPALPSGSLTAKVALPPRRYHCFWTADGKVLTAKEFAARIAPIKLVVDGREVKP